MKIAAVDVFPTRLPFREELRISRGSVGNPAEGGPHIYVRITADTGEIGWGEARPSHRWSYETEESVVTTLRNYLATAVIGRDAWDLRGFYAAMGAQIAPGISTGAPIARSGLDMALHDLLARSAGVPLAAFLGGPAGEPLALTYLISVPTPEEAGRRAGEQWAAGYRGFKVKIGGDPRHDFELVRAVKEAAPNAYLWADANQAYDLPTAITLARKLETLEVECLEQPLPANDWTGLRRLARDTATPIAVDESVFAPADLLQLIQLEACELLVVKVSKLGGIGPAALTIRIAREAGLGVLGSGLTESRLGLTAAAHLLTACGGCRFADLNGPQFLGDDPIAAEELDLRPGQVTTPTGPGIGISPDEARLKAFSRG